jgi:hypothetical protein
MNEVNLAPECWQSCNSMRHLETVEARQVFADDCAMKGLKMVCPSPLPGQKHPICRLPEETKRATEGIVRPLLRDQRAIADATASNTLTMRREQDSRSRIQMYMLGLLALNGEELSMARASIMEANT